MVKCTILDIIYRLKDILVFHAENDHHIHNQTALGSLKNPSVADDPFVESSSASYIGPVRRSFPFQVREIKIQL